MFLGQLITKVKQVTNYAKHVIHLTTSPELPVLETFDELQVNEELIGSLKEVNRKQKDHKKGNGFLIPIAMNRNKSCEITVFLGELELNIFNYLDRKSSQSNSLFFCGLTKTRILH